MAEFKEKLVINALHADKAELCKKYWYTDNLKLLKKHVEENDSKCVGELKSIEEGEDFCCFNIDNKCSWELLYPYEEPPKQRMTNRMLAEWCNKGNGEYSYRDDTLNYTEYSYEINKNEDVEVDDEIVVRSWDSDEWIEPTVDIYERDCKKE